MPQTPGTFSKSKPAGRPNNPKRFPRHEGFLICEKVNLDTDPDYWLFWTTDGELFEDQELTIPTGLRIVGPTD